VYLTGKNDDLWKLRYKTTEIVDGRQVRRHKNILLGTLAELPKRRDALRAAEPYLAKVNDPSYKPTQSVGFTEFVEQWKSTMLGQYKPSTVLDIQSRLRRYILPAFGGKRLVDLTPPVVQQFVNALPPGRARNVTMTLRKLWELAKEWGYAEFDMACLRYANPEPAKSRWFNEDEIKRIIAAAEEPWKTMYWLAAETGLRWGELSVLRYVDFDFERRCLFVERSISGGEILDSTKSKSGERVLSLSTLLVARVAQMAGFHKSEDLVFGSKAGKPRLECNVLRRHLHPLLERLGIPRGAFHAFRHGNVTLMDRVHAPSQVKLERAGHASEAMSKRYTHVESADERRVADEVGQVISGMVQ